MSTITFVSATKPASARPMLTLDGRALLKDRAARLREGQIPALRAAVVDSRHDGSARQDLDRALAELDILETTLDVAGIVPVAKSDASSVELGDLATVECPGSGGGRARVERFRLVHPIEAPLDSERISVESPLARALLGARVGQTVAVDAPARRYHVRVLAVVRPNLPPGSRRAA
jgi:transcription elongation factor GreA